MAHDAALHVALGVDRHVVHDGAPDDDTLIRRIVAQGDSAAYDTLVARYSRRAFAIAFRVLGHREDAEDLVQDAFFTAYRRLDTFQLGRPFGPWFYRILVNRGLDLRAARSRLPSESMSASMTGGVSLAAPAPQLDAAERADVTARFRTALQRLPERTRQVVQLIDLEGFSRSEVTAALGMTAVTVRWHYHVGWRSLRAALMPLFGELAREAR
jgi:RNA polymerase sigma-70 factor (ECF subfamily)